MVDIYDPKLAKSVPCPVCGALPGQPCKSKTGNVQAGYHRKRIQEYNKIALGPRWS